MEPQAFAILSTLASVLLAINAYFVKQLVDSINETKISVAVLIQQNSTKDTELKRVNSDIAELKALNKTLSHRLVACEVHLQIKQMKNEGEIII